MREAHLIAWGVLREVREAHLIAWGVLRELREARLTVGSVRTVVGFIVLHSFKEE